jgi:hypothetical protein
VVDPHQMRALLLPVPVLVMLRLHLDAGMLMLVSVRPSPPSLCLFSWLVRFTQPHQVG